jgi:protein-export membrane protein SecD/preprotein translocase SecF subunit
MYRKPLLWIIILASLAWPVVVKLHTGQWPKPHTSLDFAGGIRLAYEMDPSDQVAKGITNDTLRKQALQQAKDTFLFRLRDFNLSELSVRTVGDQTLLVEAPGIEEIQDVLDRLGHAQVITFRVLEEGMPFEPDDVRPCFHFSREQMCRVVGESVMEHDDFKYEATRVEQQQPDPQSNLGHQSNADQYVVVLSIKSQTKFTEVTSKYYQRRLAICLDREIVTAPQIRDVIHGDAIITGYQARSEAEDIVKLLRAGPLPVSFNLTEQRVISPTLGQRSLHSALIILPVGVVLIFVLLFLAYSNQPEFVAMIVVCQLVQASAVYFLAWVGLLVLSLLSVCALAILSGVAVDGLILIFEEFARVKRKEERMLTGNVLRSLDKALVTERPVIRWANFLGMLPVIPLYFVGEPVRSLVVTMAIGTLLAVVTTLVVGRWMVASEWVLEGLKKTTRQLRPLLGLHFNLFAVSKYLLGIYLIALAMSPYLLIHKGQVNSIDFTSGAEIVLQSDVGIDTEFLERFAGEYFKRRCSVRHLTASVLQPGGSLSYAIQVPGLESQLQSSQAASSRSGPTPAGLAASLQESVSHPVRLASVSSVGATVTGITEQTTIIASIIGLVVLTVFLIGIFDVATGMSIVVVMVLDATITLGAISFFNIPWSLPILSALLTVVGYSVYDSIVVARHVWNDCQSGQYSDHAFNESLKNLSRRMVLTVATTAASGIAVAIYCEGLLRDFGIVMSTGAIFGMMSTAAVVARAIRFSLKRLPRKPVEPNDAQEMSVGRPATV